MATYPIDLKSIDAKTLTNNVCEREQDYLGRRLWHHEPLVGGEPAGPDVRDHSLALAIETLTLYAQGGDIPEGNGTAHDFIQSVCEALFVRPFDTWSYATPELDAALNRDEYPSDEIQRDLLVVLVAAIRRSQHNVKQEAAS